jgi:hypothetical protein
MQSLSFITSSRNPEASQEIREALNGTSRARVLTESHDYDALLADAMRLRPSAAVIVLETEAQEKAFSVIKKLSAA